MFGNYLITALRNFRKNRLYVFINLLGLTLGLTCCLVFYSIIKHELTFDDFHPNSDQIFRVVEHHVGDNGMDFNAVLPNAMPFALATEFAHSRSVIPMHGPVGATVEIDHNRRLNVYKEEDNIIFANSSFLKSLNFPIKTGGDATELDKAFTAFITVDIANKYFGSDNPIGEFMLLDESITVEIVGILENTPTNTNTPFEILVSYPTIFEWNGNYIRNWSAHWVGSAYFVLDENQDIPKLESDLSAFAHQYLSEYDRARNTYHLQPLSEVHTNTQYDHGVNYVAPMEILTGLGALAVVILIASILNFINLATAQAIQRSREVGIRKTLGSTKGLLIYQFLGETLILVLTSTLLAITLGQVFLDQINSYLTLIAFEAGYDASTLIFALALMIVTTFLSGFYPAFVISRYKPIDALQNQINLSKGSGSFSIRKGMVITQFIIANLLIITTIVVSSQMNYIKSKDLGFDPINVAIVEFPEEMSGDLQLIKTEIEKLNFVESATRCQAPPQYTSSWNTAYQIQGLEPNENMTSNIKFIDGDYLKTFDIKLVDGRDILPTSAYDSVSDLLVNQMFLNEAGLDPNEAIGKEVTFMGSWKGRIIGLVEDYHFEGLQLSIGPAMMTYHPDYMRQLNIKLAEGNPEEQKVAIESVFRDFNADAYFEMTVLTDLIEENYVVERIAFTVFQVFSLIAILIGGLGLYGLVSFMASRNKKSISIRKVFGASASNIIGLFSWQFLQMIIISFVVGSPIGYWLCREWLNNFQYRIDISPVYFIVAGAVIILITILTAGFKSYQVATQNPVDTLRHE